MTRLTRHVAVTGAALATAGALIAATPTINADHDLALASAPAVTTTSTAIDLMSYSEWKGNSGWHGQGGGGSQAKGAGSYHDDDDDEDQDEGDDDHDGWGGGGGGGFGNISTIITDFLTNNQAQVLSVTAQIPVFNIGSVPVGNSLLANAYYTGFDPGTGTPVTGLPGVVAYVTSQIGVPSGNMVQDVVLGLTSITPRINIGPLAVGNGILAGAYFNGYDSGSGLVTGVPGVISYVTNSLGLQAAPVAAVKAKAKATAAVAPASAVVAARSAAAVAAPADAADSAAVAAKADDSPRVARSALGRATAKAASSAGKARSAAARAAAK
jgi:hypothetical protein